MRSINQPNNHRQPGPRGPIVWVPQDQGTKNLFPATFFGTLQVFTRHELTVLDPMAVDQWVDDLGTWISGYDPEQDFVLLIGDPVLISVLSAQIALMFSHYTALKWDRQSKVYLAVELRPGKGVIADNRE